MGKILEADASKRAATSHSRASSIESRETGILLGIVLTLLFSFVYFSQGGGHNQNATIAEIRNLVEKGTFDISEYEPITGDVSYYQGKVVSNKSANIIFFVAPVYFLYYRAAVLFGLDTHSIAFQFFTVEFLTFWIASIWGALLALVIYFLQKELFPQIGQRTRIVLSFALCLSTLAFPYSTCAFLHSFEAFWVCLCLLCLAYYSKETSLKTLIALSCAFGVSLLANPLLVLLAPGLYLVILLKDSSWFRAGCIFSLTVLLTLTPFFLYNWINFDHPLHNNRMYLGEAYRDDSLVLGVFGSPQLIRLKELFLIGNRSLFPQLFLLLPFLIPILIRRKSLPRWEVLWFPLGVVLLYTSVVLCFNGWHGGSNFGPRYYLPAIMMLAVLSLPFVLKIPGIYFALLLFSYLCLFVVSSVNVMPAFTDPQPFFDNLNHFLNGRIAPYSYPSFLGATEEDYSFNLGQVIGLNGIWSVIPLLALHFLVLLILLLIPLTSPRAANINQS